MGVEVAVHPAAAVEEDQQRAGLAGRALVGLEGTYSRPGGPHRQVAHRTDRLLAAGQPGLAQDRPPPLGDRQRLRPRLAGQPLQPQHQLGVGGQGLAVADHPAAGEQPLHRLRAGRGAASGSALRGARAGVVAVLDGGNLPVPRTEVPRASFTLRDATLPPCPSASPSLEDHGAPRRGLRRRPAVRPRRRGARRGREVRRPLPRPRAVLAARSTSGCSSSPRTARCRCSSGSGSSPSSPATSTSSSWSGSPASSAASPPASPCAPRPGCCPATCSTRSGPAPAS